MAILIITFYMSSVIFLVLYVVLKVIISKDFLWFYIFKINKYFKAENVELDVYFQDAAH